jgi:5-oxoprolinase (ATP-hydrolysing) subunit A
VVTMVTSGRVTAIDGTHIAVSVESVCVHGDSPGAVQIATAVRQRLTQDGVTLAPFV